MNVSDLLWAGPSLDEKLVRLDYPWLTKNVPAGPILVTKSGLAWPKWSSVTISVLMPPQCIL